MQASRYHILGLIGQGQFGKVYCASDRRTGQLVALKELTHQRSPTNQFLQELWFIISLQHPNIATCRALEHIQTGRYLVMDYCEGGTLRHLLEQRHSLRLQESLQLLIGVLEGLHYAHQRGIIHCDIKPENILLTLKPQGWHPKLSDFGIARHLPNGGQFSSAQKASMFTGGSPAYMAPERFYGFYSPQSDLYAIGVVLFEILTGDRPFHGLPGELMWAQLNQRLQVPSFIPEVLKSVIQKSLEKLPARRYSSALEMAEALQQALAHSQIQNHANTIISWQSNQDDVQENLSEGSLTPVQSCNKLLTQILPLPTVTSEKYPLILTPNFPELYTAFEQKLEIWSHPLDIHNPSTSVQLLKFKIKEQIKFPEPILSLLSIKNNNFVLTKHKIYRFTSLSTPPQVLLNLSSIQPGLANHLPVNPIEQLLEMNCSPPNHLDLHEFKLKSSVNLNYKIAIDPDCRYMALALAGQLHFYSLSSNLEQSAPNLNKTIFLSFKEIPEIIFLNERYLLAAWLNYQQKSINILKIYTRKGKLVGNLKLPFFLKQLISLTTPYSLLGIGGNQQPFILLICLKPLSIIRIPLDDPPICTGVTPWGFVVANRNGQYTFFNLEGNPIGNYTGPVNPKAIAPLGKTGLAIATYTNNQGYLHLIQSINCGKQND